MDIRERIAGALGRAGDEVARLHAAHVNPGLHRALEVLGHDRRFVRAEGLLLIDDRGREVLDFLAGYGAIPLGHDHPEVRAAVETALAARPVHFHLVGAQPLAAELARRLCELAPGGMGTVAFGSSGSEAVEAALKLARLATRRGRFVSAERGYHGTTLGALSVTGSARHRRPFEPLLAASRIRWGDADAVERELRRRDVAAVILEPLQGEGGVHPAPPGWLAEVARLCRRYGTLLVVDEVQTGLGRCGSLFLCAEERVEPDALLLAKGLSGGLAPIGAMLTRADLWRRAFGTIERHDLHCSTFGGGAIACAAALAAVEVIVRDGLAARAAALGAVLGERIRAACAGHPLVRDVRGRGLFWGIELGAPGVTAEIVGGWVTVGLLERGVLAQTCSAAPGVVRAQPPLVVTPEAIDRFAAALTEVLASHAPALVPSLGRAAVRAASRALRGPAEPAAGGE